VWSFLSLHTSLPINTVSIWLVELPRCRLSELPTCTIIQLLSKMTRCTRRSYHWNWWRLFQLQKHKWRITSIFPSSDLVLPHSLNQMSPSRRHSLPPCKWWWIHSPRWCHYHISTREKSSEAPLRSGSHADVAVKGEIFEILQHYFHSKLVCGFLRSKQQSA
jgi:hypothetical protein